MLWIDLGNNVIHNSKRVKNNATFNSLETASRDIQSLKVKTMFELIKLLTLFNFIDKYPVSAFPTHF